MERAFRLAPAGLRTSPATGTGLWVGIELLLIVLRCWLAGALGVVTAGYLLGSSPVLAAVGGFAVVAAVLPYRSIRATRREMQQRDPLERVAFLRGLVLALLLGLGMLWLGMLAFLSVSLGTIAEAASVPDGVVAALLLLVTVASFAVLVVTARARTRQRLAHPDRS
jgi:hypothetical protein